MIIIQDVIDVFREMADMPPDSPTVDGLVCGQAGQEVRGIAVTFMASQRVVEEAVRLGANLIVTHEGLYYSHAGPPEGPRDNVVCAAKAGLLAAEGIAVYRLHDAVHRTNPDIITEGLIRELGWKASEGKQSPEASVVELPAMSAAEVAAYVKDRLGLKYLRLAGDPQAVCRRIGVMVGYRGGSNLAVPLMEREGLDLLMYGEGPEWETPEYIRDAACQGRDKALLVLGHAESEVPGMRAVAELLRQRFPGLPVFHMEPEPVFEII